jgi:murein DD-endopeptidase MepM/ murein hydrolase activator NlpD
MKKQLSLILVPHDNSNVKNFRIPYGWVYAFITLLLLTIGTVTFFVATYGRVLYKAQRADRLETQNTELLTRNAQVDSLRMELIRVQAMGIQIKKMLGMGLSFEDSILVANLSPIVKSPAISDQLEADQALKSEQQLLLKAVPSLWPVKGYVTREFHTTGGEKSEGYHPGMDIAAKRNTTVRASAEGVVVTSRWDETYGYMVVIDHGFGIVTLYGHNARNQVKAGDRVARGQVIAFLGSTGKSTAPHLHFEVRKNGIPVNPRDYLLN